MQAGLRGTGFLYQPKEGCRRHRLCEIMRSFCASSMQVRAMHAALATRMQLNMACWRIENSAPICAGSEHRRRRQESDSMCCTTCVARLLLRYSDLLHPLENRAELFPEYPGLYRFGWICIFWCRGGCWKSSTGPILCLYLRAACSGHLWGGLASPSVPPGKFGTDGRV